MAKLIYGITISIEKLKFHCGRVASRKSLSNMSDDGKKFKEMIVKSVRESVFAGDTHVFVICSGTDEIGALLYSKSGRVLLRRGSNHTSDLSFKTGLSGTTNFVRFDEKPDILVKGMKSAFYWKIPLKITVTKYMRLLTHAEWSSMFTKKKYNNVKINERIMKLFASGNKSESNQTCDSDIKDLISKYANEMIVVDRKMTIDVDDAREILEDIHTNIQLLSQKIEYINEYKAPMDAESDCGQAGVIIQEYVSELVSEDRVKCNRVNLACKLLKGIHIELRETLRKLGVIDVGGAMDRVSGDMKRKMCDSVNRGKSNHKRLKLSKVID